MVVVATARMEIETIVNLSVLKPEAFLYKPDGARTVRPMIQPANTPNSIWLCGMIRLPLNSESVRPIVRDATRLPSRTLLCPGEFLKVLTAQTLISASGA